MTNIIEISGKAKSLKWKETIYPCNIGYGGITNNKTEGDKCTPTGFYPIREVMYRLDRIKNITSKGFVRSNLEEKLVDLSNVRINLKTKN